MTLRQGSAPEPDENTIREWLRKLEQEETGCYLCHRILFETQVHAGKVTTLEIRGVEFSPEEQIAHLARCVPEGKKRRE